MISVLRTAILILALAMPAVAADDATEYLEDGDGYVEDGDGAGMFSSMMNAAQRDDWDTVRRLARVEAPSGELEPDMTVLHHAAMRADRQTVVCLLKAGADKTVKDNYGKLPYDYALKNAKLDATTRDMLRAGKRDAGSRGAQRPAR